MMKTSLSLRAKPRGTVLLINTQTPNWDPPYPAMHKTKICRDLVVRILGTQDELNRETLNSMIYFVNGIEVIIHSINKRHLAKFTALLMKNRSKLGGESNFFSLIQGVSENPQ